MKRTYNSFLNIISKKMQTDAAYIFNGGIWLGFGQVATTIIGLIATVIFANILTPEALGTYQFIITVTGLIGIFSLTGLHTSLIRTVARGNDKVLTYAIRAHLRWSAIMTTLAFLIAAYYYLQDNYALATTMVFASILLPIIRTYSLYIPYIEGKKQFKKSTYLSIIKSLIPTIFLLIALYLTRDPILLAIVSMGANAAIIYALYRFTILSESSMQDGTDREMVTYAKHLSVMSLLSRSVPYLERIVLFGYLGPVALAIYHFATLVPNQTKDIDRIIKKLILPKLSQQKLSVLKKTLPKKVLLYFLMTFVIAIIYILVAQLFFELVLPQYTEAIVYSQVYALTLLFAPATVFSRALTAHMKKRSLYIQSIFLPIVSLGLLFALVPIYGIWGLITSRLASGAVGSLVMIYFFYTAQDTTDESSTIS